MRTEFLQQLAELYDKQLNAGPFPLEEARKVGRGRHYPDFHAALIHYLAGVAGIASHGKRLSRITPERRQEFQGIAAQSFFARYPQFSYIEERMRTQDVPALRALLEATERARLLIVEALADVPEGSKG